MGYIDQKGQTMHSNESQEEQFLVFIHKYENAIKGVAGAYSPHGSYLFHSMACDLTTHLWIVYPKMPSGMNEHEEAAWVFAVLNNKARNMLRSERLLHSRIIYRENMPDVEVEDEEASLTRALYESIANLDQDDQEVLEMYLDNKTMKEIGVALGGSNRRAHRRLHKIRHKLHELIQQIFPQDAL